MLNKSVLTESRVTSKSDVYHPNISVLDIGVGSCWEILESVHVGMSCWEVLESVHAGKYWNRIMLIIYHACLEFLTWHVCKHVII